ncbi:MAG: suppressor of fused domain protein [bacterium]|nr:suppressor of fused domain protein [bacterium]
MPNPLLQTVLEHAETCWPKRTVESQKWGQGGIVENIVDLGVVRVAPPEAEMPWIYISAGAATEPMEDGYGIEFFMLAEHEDSLVTKLVAMVAHLHADPRYPISLGQVLEIGQPWLPGASADHLLVCLADALGPEFEWCSDPERTIRFVWLVPITASEAVFARANNYIALQEKFGAKKIDLSKRVRESVV